MTVIELGALGEFVGSIAVLFTLIFLALQIRQNTNAVQGSTELEVSKLFTEWHARVVSSDDIKQLWLKDARDEAMDDEELLQYLWHQAETFFLGEGIYNQFKRGLLPERNWKPWRDFLVGLTKKERLNAWWEEAYLPISEDFREYIDDQRQQGSDWRIPTIKDLMESEQEK